jgi:PAP2 superfamily protein
VSALASQGAESGRRGSVAVALLWRYACHAAMLYLSLLTEARPAPHVPLALLLWRRDRAGFLRFLYLGGWLSLARGLCVGLTVLGPAYGPDVNAGLHGAALLHAWVALVNPFATLFGNAAHVYLTKDMFFSGHASTTFLLWLYCRRQPWLGAAALAAHLATVAVIFLSHLHYTIDVVGAWAITFSLYALVEGWSSRQGAAESGPSRPRG